MNKFILFGLSLLVFLQQACTSYGSSNTANFVGTAEGGGLASIRLFSAGKPSSRSNDTPLPSKSTLDFDAVLEKNGQKQTLSTQLEHEDGARFYAFADDAKAVAFRVWDFLIYRHNGLGKFGVVLKQSYALNDEIRENKLPLSAFSGTYNFVSKDKIGLGYGGLTIDIKAKTWAYWLKEDASANAKGHFLGTVVEKEDGRLEAILTEIAPIILATLAAKGLNITINSKFANFVLNRETHDKSRLMVIDLVALGGFALGAQQSEVKHGHFDGKYQLLSAAEDKIFEATIDGTQASIRAKKMAIQFNKPFTGFISDGAGFVGLTYGKYQRVYFGINGEEIFAGISASSHE